MDCLMLKQVSTLLSQVDVNRQIAYLRIRKTAELFDQSFVKATHPLSPSRPFVRYKLPHQIRRRESGTFHSAKVSK